MPPKKIDFKDIKWGAFTKDAKKYGFISRVTGKPLLRSFSRRVISDSENYPPIVVKRARFYRNVILKKSRTKGGTRVDDLRRSRTNLQRRLRDLDRRADENPELLDDPQYNDERAHVYAEFVNINNELGALLETDLGRNLLDEVNTIGRQLQSMSNRIRLDPTLADDVGFMTRLSDLNERYNEAIRNYRNVRGSGKRPRAKPKPRHQPPAPSPSPRPRSVPAPAAASRTGLKPLLMALGLKALDLYNQFQVEPNPEKGSASAVLSEKLYDTHGGRRRRRK